MKKLLSLLLGLALTGQAWAHNPADWYTCTEFGIPKKSPVQELALFFNSYTGAGPIAGVWQTVDLTGKVPLGTKAVFLSGILIITHGTTEETADLTVAFRRTGETFNWNYGGQAVEASVTGGQRSTMSVWVPLSDDLKFEYKWGRSNGGQWPQYSAYGGNLSLNAYCK